MRAMGVRLWADKMAFVVLECTDGSERVVTAWNGKMPPELGPERLDWLYHEIEVAVRQHHPTFIGIRVTEPGARGSDDLRAEAEGVVQLVAVRAGVRVARYARTSMSPLLKTQAKGAFAEFPKTDPLISALKVDQRDAGMAAMTALRSLS